MGMTARRGSTTRRTYAVRGATLAEIERDMKAKGPRDPNDGKRYSGSCLGRLDLALGANDFEFATTPNVTPVAVTATLKGGTVSSPCTITTPLLRTATSLSSAAKREWERFLVAVNRHEDGHADAMYDEAVSLCRELNAMSAQGSGRDERSARRAANAALVQKISAAYGGAVLNTRVKDNISAYDRSTRHGESQGAVLDTGIT
jgi:predicted secreted Zn-dependent protease